MDMSQLRFVGDDTNVTPNYGRHGGSSGDRARRPAVRAAAASARQALLELASTQLGVPVASLTVKSRASSRAAARPSPTAQLLGDKLFNVDDAGELHDPVSPATATAAVTRPVVPGAPGTKPISQYTLVGTTRAADRHPGQGHRQVHVHPQRPRPGDAARPRRPAARPGRLRRRHEPDVALGRRELDQAPPGRAGRAQGQLRRRRRAARVRRDPGRRPAQGQWADPAADLR